jgi:hypothetical protein
MLKAIALGGALWLVAAPAGALPLQPVDPAAVAESAREGFAEAAYRRRSQVRNYYRRGQYVRTYRRSRAR